MREKKRRRKGVGAQERERRRVRVERKSEEKRKRKRKRKNEETDGRNRIASPDLEFNSHANHNEAAINTRKASQRLTATEMVNQQS